MPLLKSLNREAVDEDSRARTKTYSSAVNKIRSRTEETLPETTKDVLTVENFESSLQQLINSVSEFMTSLMNTKTRIEEGKIGAFSDSVFKDNVEKLMKLSTAYSQSGRILRRIYRAGEGSQTDINMLKDKLKESGITLNLDRISTDLEDLNTRTAQYSNMITAFDRIKNGITSGEFPDVAFDKSLTGLVRIGATEARDITRKKLEAREREGELIPDILKTVGIKDDPLSLEQAVRNGELSDTQVDDLIRFYQSKRITPAERGVSSAERQREIDVINRKYKRLTDALTSAARDAGLVVPVPLAAPPPMLGMAPGRPGRPGVPPPRGRGKALYGSAKIISYPTEKSKVEKIRKLFKKEIDRVVRGTNNYMDKFIEIIYITYKVFEDYNITLGSQESALISNYIDENIPENLRNDLFGLYETMSKAYDKNVSILINVLADNVLSKNRDELGITDDMEGNDAEDYKQEFMMIARYLLNAILFNGSRIIKDEEDEAYEEMEGDGLYGGSQTLTVPPDVETARRFTPLRLYNDEGQDIYALRRYEV